ncbi:hypothetical protein SH661x_001749 [Planctomicrobium sp. SH661]|uniref:hypothetical protein n=1 Tax=Planctomicrobium sp. SH661 TaxID=3448124 RepID=UPI003F5C565A
MNSRLDTRQVPLTAPESGAGLISDSGRRISILMIVASMAVITARLADAPVLRSANDRSRWCTVWSIVERNSYQIDEIRQQPGWDTIDLVRHKDHFYSSKPPLLPRIVAEMYRAVKAVTGWTLTDHTAEITRILLFLLNVVPMGLALYEFSGLVERYSRDLWIHLFIMACACWGMMLLPFLTVFNNHTVAASCFFLALPQAVKILVEERTSAIRYFLCGVLVAFGVCNELPAALFGLCLFFMLLHHDAKKTLIDFSPGAILVFAAFFWTNYQATGSLQPFYTKYGTETYEFEYEGVPSYWKDPKGIDKPRDSLGKYLLHCTVGHHGIFSLSPMFLLTLGTWLFPPLYWQSRLRMFHLLGLGLTCATLGFYLTKTQNYNYGGVSVSLRWMMWLTPFWLLSMLPILSLLGRKKWFRSTAIVLLSISVFSAWYPTNTPWTQNWIYQWMTAAKWIDYSDPPPKFSKAHYTWIGSLPSGDLQPNYWIVFQTVIADGSREKLRLQDGGPAEGGRRLLLISRISDRQPETQVAGYLVDVSKFNLGRPVEEFLVQRQDGSSITDEDLDFFRGMPRTMRYLSSRIRHEKTRLRKDAIRCQVGYTNATVKGVNGTDRRVVRDVWYSEEVPFGVLKWEDRVELVSDKQVISRQVWQADETGEFLERQAAPPF